MKGIIGILFVVLLLNVVSGKRVLFYSAEEHPQIGGPMNVCQDFAADEDMKNVGIIPAVSNFCQSQFGKTPDAVEVNADQYPYKMCLSAQNASFGNLNPTTGMQMISKDSFNNTSNQTVQHSFTLGGTFEESIVVSTTTTVELSMSVSYEINLPDIFKETFTMGMSFSTSTTTQNSADNSLSFSPSSSYDCDPHCFYEVDVNIEEFTYSAEVTVDICLSGYARCSYNSRVQGHYYWYVLIDDFISEDDRCFTQNGALSAITANTNSTTTLKKNCY